MRLGRQGIHEDGCQWVRRVSTPRMADLLAMCVYKKKIETNFLTVRFESEMLG